MTGNLSKLDFGKWESVGFVAISLIALSAVVEVSLEAVIEFLFFISSEVSTVSCDLTLATCEISIVTTESSRVAFNHLLHERNLNLRKLMGMDLALGFFLIILE
jgi:hypothetical protein